MFISLSCPETFIIYLGEFMQLLFFFVSFLEFPLAVTGNTKIKARLSINCDIVARIVSN